jgi:fumarate hydratase, class II
MCESVLQVCARVVGNDATVTWAAAQLSTFELNVGMPVIAHAVLESCRLLAAVVELFQKRCVDGIRADQERCAGMIEHSLAMVTSLVPKIGYLKAAEIAKESAATGKTIRELCREKGVLPDSELESALDPATMTRPGGTVGGGR